MYAMNSAKDLVSDREGEEKYWFLPLSQSHPRVKHMVQELDRDREKGHGSFLAISV